MGFSFCSCYRKPELTKSVIFNPSGDNKNKDNLNNTNNSNNLDKNQEKKNNCGLKKTILTNLEEIKEDTFECGLQNETNENIYNFDNLENININFPNGQ